MRVVIRDFKPVPCWPRRCVACGDPVLQPHSQFVKAAPPACRSCRRAGIILMGVNRGYRAPVRNRTRIEFDDLDVTADGSTARTEEAVANEKAIWSGIKDRCFNPLCPDYPKYGGKGVVMCPEWKEDFWAFYTFMGPRPSPRHSVGRVKNHLGYQPVDPNTGEVQVRWEIKEEQARNQTHNRRIPWRGEERLLVELAEELQITPVGLSLRIGKARKELVDAAGGLPADPKARALLEEEAVERAMTDPVRRIKTALGDNEEAMVEDYLRTGDSAPALALRWKVSQRTIHSALVRHGARKRYIELHGAESRKVSPVESTIEACPPAAPVTDEGQVDG